MNIDRVTHDAITNILMRERDDANSHYERNLEPNITTNYQIYNADPEFYKQMFPLLSKTSSLTSTDVRDTIEWALPSLVKIFFGSSDLVSIQGQTADDDHNAQVMQDLINYQLQRRNKAFMVFYQWFKDALITNLGIIKCYWDREEKVIKQEIKLSPDAVEAFIAQPDIEALDMQFDPVDGGVTVIFNGPKVVKNQPVIENILASEFRYSPEANNLDEADFIAHRKNVTVDYLKRKAQEGVYDEEQVKMAIEQGKDEQYTLLEEENNEYLAERKNKHEKARQRMTLYECYCKMTLTQDESGAWKYDEDALLENYIITIVDDVILRIEKNHYGRHPFFVVSPQVDPHKVWPTNGGYSDMVGQIQHLKTALTRQFVTSLALSNNPKLGIDVSELWDVSDVTENRSIIRLRGNKPINQVFAPVAQHQPSRETLPFMQYLDSVNSDRTGISDYTKGQDAGNALNDTATGISIITQSANKRLELVARIFLESGVLPLYRFLIELNQKFIDEETVIRLTNKTYQIRPDDLTGEFDLIVGGSLGINNKEMKMATNMQLQQLVEKLVPTGLVGPMQIYNTATRIMEELEIKNTDDYVMNPQLAQQQQMEAMLNGGLNPTGAVGAVNPAGQPGAVSAGLPGQMGSAIQGQPTQPNIGHQQQPLTVTG
jgi:hypothetical protein